MGSSSKQVSIKELPLYESCCCGGQSCKPKTPPPSILEPYVKSAREECEAFLNPILGDYPRIFQDKVKSSVQFANESFNYLRNEQNQAARAAFITSIGFMGFILGRKGLIKRTIYGLVGAGAAAAACNPPIAKDYAEVSYALLKQKTNQLYQQYGGKLSYEDLKQINWNILESKPAAEQPSK